MVTTKRRVCACVCFCVAAIAFAGWSRAYSASTPPGLASHEPLLAAYASLPLAFVENRGQIDSRVRFYAQGSRYAFHFTRDAAVLSFVDANGGTRGVVLSLRFVGGNPKVTLEGQERTPGEVNYFRGNDPSRWLTAIPRYSHVVYRDLWPGIDMMLRGDTGTLKYEFRVRPGAHIADIQLAYDGSKGLTLDDAGGLLIDTALGVLRDSRPVAYQTVAGARVPVESRYLLNDGQYSFALGATYDPGQELVIDPGLDYSTLLGGSSHESAAALAVDASGNAYVTGLTQSPDFPTTAGAFDRTGSASNNLDAFVTKVNANGTALIYSTFLGGGNFEWGRGIAVDAAGNAYVAGQTKSSDFPTTAGAFDRTFNVDTCPRCGIDQYDAFVAKLNASGSGLVYSTFLGGFDLDDALAIAIDGSGNAYIGGETGSSTFPTTAGALDASINGAFDAFVTKLNAAGSALVYSTYLGGLEVDYVQRVVVDSSGQAYLAGPTRSADFPTTPGAFDTTQNGGFDTFLLKLDASGSALRYSTFLGGLDVDFAGGLAIDADGNAYVSGGTLSPDYPVTPGALDDTLDDSDAFVTKVNATGSALMYSTFVGGTGGEGASALVVDGGGNAWIAGGTSSADFPTTADGFDTSFNGTSDAFVAEIDATGSVLRYSTFLGGTSSESAADLALDPGGNVIVTGQTVSADFPTTSGAFDRVFNGDPLIFWGDAFVTKLAVGNPLPPPPPPGGGGGGGGDTGLRSPAANAVNSGGDGNGFESSPANAHADDAMRAVDNNSGTGSSTSCTSTSKDKHQFSNYGFTFPAGVAIRGIEVRLDARADSTSSSPKMCVQVSWDGGTTWTSAKSTPTLGTSMGTFTLGSATDTWGRSWTTGHFTDVNFRVRVINVSSSTSRDFSLDWIAVRVHYQ
jgi:beta-propeller repeat-containing protein